MYISKKNGKVVLYDTGKIVNSILKANADTAEEEISDSKASYIADAVFARLTEEKDIITTQDIRDCVYKLLNEMGYPNTARNYMEFAKAD